MSGVVKAMDQAAQSMNLEQVSLVMDRFERQFEGLDVQSQVMENAMNASSTLSVPEGEVDTLMQKVADEHGLQLSTEMNASSIPAGTTSVAAAEQDELTERLARLRQNT